VINSLGVDCHWGGSLRGLCELYPIFYIFGA
jgi:hypothetical protein